MQKNIVYIVRGLPGTGKTTLAHKLVGASNAIAADDLPGLYKNGIYQQEMQSMSHKWCQDMLEAWMKMGKREIAVHNTFVQEEYMQPYINMALKYGYAIAIINTEKVILETGDVATNIHSVPKPVIDSMRQKWETINKPISRGITIKEIGEELKNIDLPDMILLDMDGTVKTTASGNAFPIDPTDVALNLDLCRDLRDFKIKGIPLYLVSNQAGLSFGRKTKEFLEAEVETTLQLLAKQKIFVQAAMFSVGKNSKEMLRCDLNAKSTYSNLYSYNILHQADKPNCGMGLAAIADYQRWNNTDHDPTIWIVGDGHTDANSADWEFAKNLRNKVDSIVSYIPVEMFSGVLRVIE